MTEATTTKKTPEVEEVSMTDGRIVGFTGKTRVKKDPSADETFVYIRMDFRNGETRTFKHPHGLSNIASPEGKFAAKCMLHGLEQKYGDEMSGIEDLEDAIEAVDQLGARLVKGYEGWTKASDGPSGFAGASILARAVAEATQNDIEQVRALLADMTPKEKAALRIDTQIAPIVQRLEAEKAAKAAASGKGKTAVDTKALLAKFSTKPLDPSMISGGAAEA